MDYKQVGEFAHAFQDQAKTGVITIPHCFEVYVDNSDNNNIKLKEKEKDDNSKTKY
jgi:hypothetical protein